MATTDILFGQSYYLRFDPKLWAAQQPYPPLGTLYAASYVRSLGYQVALFDAMLAESEAEWAAALDAHRPAVACLFEDNFNYLSKMCLGRMRAAALKMLRLAKARGCTVIVCGADATDQADLYLAQGADYILLGEGELTLGELLAALTGRSPQAPPHIPGLAYRSAAGQRQTTPPRPVIDNLDALPRPAWDLVDIRRYQAIWRARHGYYSMNLVTTRGCPYQCNWCAKPIWGRVFHTRSPENVAAEIQWLAAHYSVDHLWFADDIFGLQPGWIEQLAQHLQAAGLRIPFKCLMRADLVSPRVAAALAHAGGQTVWLGAESGSQAVLDAMHKGSTVQDIYAAAACLHAHQLEACFFLQFGYPGETWDDIQQTLKMVRACAPDDIGVAVSYPLPGTPFFERVKHDLGAKQNWVDSSDLALLYQGPFPADFYRHLYARVHHAFRLRRAYRAGLRRGGAAQRLRALVSIPYHLAGALWAEARLRLARQRAGH